MRPRKKHRWARERANIKTLGRSLIYAGLPGSDVSVAIPSLFRNTVEFNRAQSKVKFCLYLLVIIFEAPLFWVFYSRHLLGPGYLSKMLELDVVTLALSACGLGFLVISKVFPLDRTLIPDLTDDWARQMSRPRRQSTSVWRRDPEWILSIISSCVIVSTILFLVTKLESSQVLLASVDAGLLAVYFAGMFYVGRQARRILTLHIAPPQCVLMHALLWSYVLTSTGKASEWRSFSYRRRIALYLDTAAYVLEESLLRTVSRDYDRNSAGVGYSNPRLIADGVRQKLSWLATPKMDTRRNLARTIGEIMVIAAIGDLDRLIDPNLIPTPIVGTSWQYKLATIARWAIGGLIPALVCAVALRWELIPDPTLRTLAVQFAVICFLSATFASIGPADKLGSIVAIGGGIFGWGRQKG